MEQRRVVRIGIAGLGRLGLTHAQNLNFKVRNAELVALCDPDTDRLQAAGKSLGIETCYSSFDEMLQKGKLDAVAIVTPSAQHCKQIEQALDADCHVFCEKPLGTGMEESYRARQAVNEHKNKVFMLGFMRRYDASYSQAKKMIDQGAIGTPVLFRSYTVDPSSSIDSVIPYIPHSAGQFMDMAVHDIDLARWMLKSEPVSVFAIGACYAHQEFGEYGDGDNVSALMQFENQAMAFFFAGRTAPHGYNVETEIIGAESSLRIGSVPQKSLLEILDKEGIRKECSQSFQERFEEAFVNEMQEFVDCILEGRKPEVSVEDGIESSRIAELATESFRTNNLIKLKS